MGTLNASKAPSCGSPALSWLKKEYLLPGFMKKAAGWRKFKLMVAAVSWEVAKPQCSCTGDFWNEILSPEVSEIPGSRMPAPCSSETGGEKNLAKINPNPRTAIYCIFIIESIIIHVEIMPFALHLPCLLMEFKAHIHQKYLKYSSQCLNFFEDLGLCPPMQRSIFYLEFPWKDT